ncbi:MAG: hypothetical protein NZZ41_05710, partial [Candidatus Dojkabacteria bacterium]|nr:hypothetical protein [Candidatus Dojkabacteria bacterium]
FGSLLNSISSGFRDTIGAGEGSLITGGSGITQFIFMLISLALYFSIPSLLQRVDKSFNADGMQVPEVFRTGIESFRTSFQDTLSSGRTMLRLGAGASRTGVGIFSGVQRLAGTPPDETVRAQILRSARAAVAQQRRILENPAVANNIFRSAYHRARIGMAGLVADIASRGGARFAYSGAAVGEQEDVLEVTGNIVNNIPARLLRIIFDPQQAQHNIRISVNVSLRTTTNRRIRSVNIGVRVNDQVIPIVGYSPVQNPQNPISNAQYVVNNNQEYTNLQMRCTDFTTFNYQNQFNNVNVNQVFVINFNSIQIANNGLSATINFDFTTNLTNLVDVANLFLGYVNTYAPNIYQNILAVQPLQQQQQNPQGYLIDLIELFLVGGGQRRRQALNPYDIGLHRFSVRTNPEFVVWINNDNNLTSQNFRLEVQFV